MSYLVFLLLVLYKAANFFISRSFDCFSPLSKKAGCERSSVYRTDHLGGKIAVRMFIYLAHFERKVRLLCYRQQKFVSIRISLAWPCAIFGGRTAFSRPSPSLHVYWPFVTFVGTYLVSKCFESMLKKKRAHTFFLKTVVELSQELMIDNWSHVCSRSETRLFYRVLGNDSVSLLFAVLWM